MSYRAERYTREHPVPAEEVDPNLSMLTISSSTPKAIRFVS
jgi:hypothetical protein